MGARWRCGGQLGAVPAGVNGHAVARLAAGDGGSDGGDDACALVAQQQGLTNGEASEVHVLGRGGGREGGREREDVVGGMERRKLLLFKQHLSACMFPSGPSETAHKW